MIDTKVALIVRDDLAAWQKLNVVAFLATVSRPKRRTRSASLTRMRRAAAMDACWASRCWCSHPT